MKTRSETRPPRGNMTMFIVAIAIMLVPLLWFGINYARILGGKGEQQTAIEAAALAAAHDVSRVVVDTPQFGYVSASDSAPVGTATPAGDQFYMPVHGINSLIGTARLDLEIATALGDPVMTALAQQDQAAAIIVAQQYLAPVLNAAAQGSGIAIAAPPMPPGWPAGPPWPPADWPTNTSQLSDRHCRRREFRTGNVSARRRRGYPHDLQYMASVHV